MATAETRDLAPVARPAASAADIPRAASAAPATAEAIAALAAPRRRRLFLALAVLALAAGGVATLIAVAHSGGKPRAAAATEPAPAGAPVAATPTSQAGLPPQPGAAGDPPTPAAGSLHTPTPAKADAHPAKDVAVDAGPAHPRATPHTSHRTAAQIQADKHLRAAEAARKSGNLLLQLAQADQAHRLDPKNRRAAELMGEALVKSGDKARGCPLLRHSRLYRQVGCAH